MPNFSLPDGFSERFAEPAQEKATAQGPTAAVAGLIAKAAGVESEDLSREQRLVEDLGIDSLDLISLAVRLEQLSGRRVEEEDAQTLRTVGDVFDFVDAQA